MDSKAVKFKDSSGNAVYPCPYYPVGSIYMSVNNINPSNFFGGTWEQIKDRFLLACGSTYSNGATGGEAQHTLTINEMPSHNHNVVMNDTSKDWYEMCRITTGAGYQAGGLTKGYAIGTGYFYISNTGENQPHNNMPPYLAVYVWKRIA